MGESPKRIQRCRTKGWRMPEGAISVTRPGVWGNPFIIGKDSGIFPGEVLVPTIRLATSLRYYRHMIECYLGPEMHPHGHDWTERCHRHFHNLHPEDAAQRYLRGHDLACWCRLCPEHAAGLPLGVTCEACRPCHATVLLELAND